jgi:hypothetical protein
MGNKEEYFRECIQDSLCVNNVVLESDVLDALAKDITLAHENIGLAFYQPENPLIHEVKDLESKLQKEKLKRGCDVCRGTGYVTESWGPIGRSSTSRCDKCYGEGKV